MVECNKCGLDKNGQFIDKCFCSEEEETVGSRKILNVDGITFKKVEGEWYAVEPMKYTASIEECYGNLKLSELEDTEVESNMIEANVAILYDDDTWDSVLMEIPSYCIDNRSALEDWYIKEVDDISCIIAVCIIWNK